MGLYERVNDDLKAAMLARDTERLRALRGIRAAFLEAVKADNRTSLPDDECVTVLRRLAKARAESLASYTDAGRDDLAAEERSDLAVIDGYLPQLADEATTRAWVRAAIAEVAATSLRDTGKVMGALAAAHKGAFDGKLAQALLKELLG